MRPTDTNTRNYSIVSHIKNFIATAEREDNPLAGYIKEAKRNHDHEFKLLGPETGQVLNATTPQVNAALVVLKDIRDRATHVLGSRYLDENLDLEQWKNTKTAFSIYTTALWQTCHSSINPTPEQQTLYSILAPSHTTQDYCKQWRPDEKKMYILREDVETVVLASKDYSQSFWQQEITLTTGNKKTLVQLVVDHTPNLADFCKEHSNIYDSSGQIQALEQQLMATLKEAFRKAIAGDTQGLDQLLQSYKNTQPTTPTKAIYWDDSFNAHPIVFAQIVAKFMGPALHEQNEQQRWLNSKKDQNLVACLNKAYCFLLIEAKLSASEYNELVGDYRSIRTLSTLKMGGATFEGVTTLLIASARAGKITPEVLYEKLRLMSCTIYRNNIQRKDPDYALKVLDGMTTSLTTPEEWNVFTSVLSWLHHGGVATSIWYKGFVLGQVQMVPKSWGSGDDAVGDASRKGVYEALSKRLQEKLAQINHNAQNKAASQAFMDCQTLISLGAPINYNLLFKDTTPEKRQASEWRMQFFTFLELSKGSLDLLVAHYHCFYPNSTEAKTFYALPDPDLKYAQEVMAHFSWLKTTTPQEYERLQNVKATDADYKSYSIIRFFLERLFLQITSKIDFTNPEFATTLEYKTAKQLSDFESTVRGAILVYGKTLARDAMLSNTWPKLFETAARGNMTEIQYKTALDALWALDNVRPDHKHICTISLKEFTNQNNLPLILAVWLEWIAEKKKDKTNEYIDVYVKLDSRIQSEAMKQAFANSQFDLCIRLKKYGIAPPYYEAQDYLTKKMAALQKGDINTGEFIAALRTMLSLGARAYDITTELQAYAKECANPESTAKLPGLIEILSLVKQDNNILCNNILQDNRAHLQNAMKSVLLSIDYTNEQDVKAKAAVYNGFKGLGLTDDDIQNYLNTLLLDTFEAPETNAGKKDQKCRDLRAMGAKIPDSNTGMEDWLKAVDWTVDDLTVEPHYKKAMELHELGAVAKKGICNAAMESLFTKAVLNKMPPEKVKKILDSLFALDSKASYVDDIPGYTHNNFKQDRSHWPTIAIALAEWWDEKNVDRELFDIELGTAVEETFAERQYVKSRTIWSFLKDKQNVKLEQALQDVVTQAIKGEITSEQLLETLIITAEFSINTLKKRIARTALDFNDYKADPAAESTLITMADFLQQKYLETYKEVCKENGFVAKALSNLLATTLTNLDYSQVNIAETEGYKTAQKLISLGASIKEDALTIALPTLITNAVLGKMPPEKFKQTLETIYVLDNKAPYLGFSVSDPAFKDRDISHWPTIVVEYTEWCETKTPKPKWESAKNDILSSGPDEALKLAFIAGNYPLCQRLKALGTRTDRQIFESAVEIVIQLAIQGKMAPEQFRTAVSEAVKLVGEEKDSIELLNAALVRGYIKAFAMIKKEVCAIIREAGAEVKVSRKRLTTAILNELLYNAGTGLITQEQFIEGLDWLHKLGGKITIKRINSAASQVDTVMQWPDPEMREQYWHYARSFTTMVDWVFQRATDEKLTAKERQHYNALYTKTIAGPKAPTAVEPITHKVLRTSLANALLAVDYAAADITQDPMYLEAAMLATMLGAGINYGPQDHYINIARLGFTAVLEGKMPLASLPKFLDTFKKFGGSPNLVAEAPYIYQNLPNSTALNQDAIIATVSWLWDQDKTADKTEYNKLREEHTNLKSVTSCALSHAFSNEDDAKCARLYDVGGWVNDSALEPFIQKAVSGNLTQEAFLDKLNLYKKYARSGSIDIKVPGITTGVPKAYDSTDAAWKTFFTMMRWYHDNFVEEKRRHYRNVYQALNVALTGELSLVNWAATDINADPHYKKAKELVELGADIDLVRIIVPGSPAESAPVSVVMALFKYAARTNIGSDRLTMALTAVGALGNNKTNFAEHLYDALTKLSVSQPFYNTAIRALVSWLDRPFQLKQLNDTYRESNLLQHLIMTGNAGTNCNERVRVLITQYAHDRSNTRQDFAAALFIIINKMQFEERTLHDIMNSLAQAHHTGADPVIERPILEAIIAAEQRRLDSLPAPAEGQARHTMTNSMTAVMPQLTEPRMSHIFAGLYEMPACKQALRETLHAQPDILDAIAKRRWENDQQQLAKDLNIMASPRRRRKSAIPLGIVTGAGLAMVTAGVAMHFLQAQVTTTAGTIIPLNNILIIGGTALTAIGLIGLLINELENSGKMTDIEKKRIAGITVTAMFAGPVVVGLSFYLPMYLATQLHISSILAVTTPIGVITGALAGLLLGWQVKQGDTGYSTEQTVEKDGAKPDNMALLIGAAAGGVTGGVISTVLPLASVEMVKVDPMLHVLITVGATVLSILATLIAIASKPTEQHLP